MTSEFGNATISNGEINGRDISWSITLSPPGAGSITVTYEGQLDGDRITGRATAGEFGSFPFTATRRPQ
jgi:hypothetical protein